MRSSFPTVLLPRKYAVIITLLAFLMLGAIVLVLSDILSAIGRHTGVSLVLSFVFDIGLLVIVLIVVAAIISFLSWGYWLGDLGRTDPSFGPNNRSEEARAALEVLEQKYARHEITMTEYLTLRKGIERDRPRY